MPSHSAEPLNVSFPNLQDVTDVETVSHATDLHALLVLWMGSGQVCLVCPWSAQGAHVRALSYGWKAGLRPSLQGGKRVRGLKLFSSPCDCNV